MNISGILVQCRPERVESLAKEISESNKWEYHHHDAKGRIIVVIEEEDAEKEINKLKELQTVKGVIAADMMYSYSEDELDELRANIENEAKIPEWLNDPNADAKDIKYNGDLKKKY